MKSLIFQLFLVETFLKRNIILKLNDFKIQSHDISVKADKFRPKAKIKITRFGCFHVTDILS